jgi:CHAT domain-containing protein/Tfp pilus assembly protein PilF
MPARLLAALILAGSSLAATLAAPRDLAPAPQSVQQEKPDDVLARARQIYNEEGPRQALPVYERALALYQAAGDRRGEAITIGLIGNCYKKFGELDKALDYLNRALAMKRELGDRLEEAKTLSNIGLVYWDKGEFPPAIDHLTRAIAISRELGDRQLEGSALNNLSLVYDAMGDYRRSLPQYQKVLELYRGLNFERGESDTIGNIGGVYLLLGQYHEALRYYQQALAISERQKLKVSASQDLGNIALCYLGIGDVARAIDHFDRALQLAREAGAAKEEADWLRGKASALVRLGKYAAAFEGFEQALGVYDRAKLRIELVEALNDVGALLARLGDGASAERSFRRAIEIARAIDNEPGVTANLVALGDLEHRRKRLDEAAALYRDALARATAAGDRGGAAGIRVALAVVSREQGRLDEASAEAGRAIDEARALGGRPVEAEALFARAEVARTRRQNDDALRDNAAAQEIATALGDPELQWRVGYGQGQALEALGRNDDAAAAYRRAVALIEDVRSQLRDERFRASYLEDKYQVYVSLVQLLLKLGRTQEAFTYAERLRARQYLEWMNRGVPPIQDEARRQAELALRERVRQLQRAIDEEHVRPEGERRQALDLFSAELIDAERDYQAALAVLLRDEPAYAAARALASVSSDDVRRKLAADTALVEYVVADEGVSIFVIRSTGIQAKTVTIRSVDLAAKVELLRDLIVREAGTDWQAPAASLYQTLVAPIEQAGWLADVHQLYLVPHGILHYVPFAALPRGREQGARLLVNDYVIAYLPAAAALADGTGDGNRNGNGWAAQSVMAVAPARTGLQFSQQEAAAVAGLFPKERLLLVGNRATETAFKTSAGRYDVLHLATHGYFNRFNPLLSGLELEPDAKEDGRLEVHEILGLKLAARLVVLSACDTALGGGYFAEVPSGDDIVGLTRAFLFAGSPSVVASLWAVNDRSTMGLMSGFYGKLSSENKATALATAQRELVARGGRYAHPYFWGAFVLVGQMK